MRPIRESDFLGATLLIGLGEWDGDDDAVPVLRTVRMIDRHELGSPKRARESY